MCTELFLALFYFLTLFIVNFFLLKLLISYKTNILFLLKLKNILNSFDKKKLKGISMFYFYSKNEFKNKSILNKFSSFSKVKDMLIIGSTYRYLSKNLSRKNNDFVSLSYYLKLLEVQFLPFFIF
jgi:hypothetical protein